MRNWILLLGVVALTAQVWAVDISDESQFEDAEGRSVIRIGPGKGVTLTEAEKVEVAKANDCLKRAYLLLKKEHKPAEACAQMGQALGVMEKMGTFKLAVMNAGQGAANVNVPGTPHDDVEMANALALLREMSQQGGGQAAAAHVDNGLKKRALLKAQKELAQKAAEDQDDLNQQLDNPPDAAGGGAQPKKQDNKKPSNAKPQAGAGGGQQQQNPNDPKSDQNQANNGGETPPNQTANANDPKNQNNPNGGPTDPKAQNNPNGNPNDPKNQNNPNENPNPNGGQTQNANNNSPTNPNQTPSQGSAGAAAKQGEIAKQLSQIAANLPKVQDGPGKDAADKFKDAAALADKNAKALESGDTNGAAARGKEVAKAIRDAMAAAGAMDEAALAKDVADLEGRATNARDKQDNVLQQTQKLGSGAGAGPQASRDEKQRALTDAQRQLRDDAAALKRDIANTAGALGNLARDGERSAAQSAKTNLDMAHAALSKGKGVEQAMVDAKVAMENGDFDAAARAMAGAKSTLEEARGRVAAAGVAMGGAPSKQAEKLLTEIKAASGAMKDVQQQANAQTGGASSGTPQANTDPKNQNGAADPNAKNPAADPKNPTGKGNDPNAKNPAADPKDPSGKGNDPNAKNPAADPKDPSGKGNDPNAKHPAADPKDPSGKGNDPNAKNPAADPKDPNGKGNDPNAKNGDPKNPTPDPKNPTGDPKNPTGTQQANNSGQSTGGGKTAADPKSQSQSSSGGASSDDPTKNQVTPTEWNNTPGQNETAQKPAQVSASLAKVMNDNVRNSQANLTQIARMVAQTNPELARKVFDEKFQKALTEEVNFERDFGGSLKKVQGIMATLDKAAAELQPIVTKDAERSALREATAEPIPLLYRGSVADYFYKLSADPKSEHK